MRKRFKEMTRKELIKTCYSLIWVINKLKSENKSGTAKPKNNSDKRNKRKSKKKNNVCTTIKEVIKRNPKGWFAVHYANKKEFEKLRDTLIALNYHFFLCVDERPFEKILNDCAEEDGYNGCFRIKVDYEEVSYNQSVQHWIDNGLQVLEMSDFMN